MLVGGEPPGPLLLPPPSLALGASGLPCTSVFIAVWKNILSFQITGDEFYASPASLTFHLTFSVSLHVNGGLPSGDIPLQFGPRHVGQ